MKEKLKKLYDNFLKFCWGYLFLSLGLLAVGLLYCLYPTELPGVIHLIVGIGMMLCGVLTGVRALGQYKAGQPIAAMVVTCGAAVIGGGFILFSTIFNAESKTLFDEYIGLAVGLWGIMDGSFKLKTAVSAVHNRLFSWWLLSIFSIFPVIGGVWLLRWTPKELVWLSVVTGCTMIAMGLLNLFALILEPIIRRRAERDKTVVTVVASDEARRQAMELTAENTEPEAPTEEKAPVAEEDVPVEEAPAEAEAPAETEETPVSSDPCVVNEEKTEEDTVESGEQSRKED